MPKIVVLSGKSQGSVFELTEGDTFEVGTARKALIHLRDRGVSYQHAKILRRGAAFVLVDGGTPQGTAINRKRVTTEQELKPGDLIGLGEIELRFEDGAAVAAPAPAPAAPVAPRPTAVFIEAAADPAAPAVAAAPPPPPPPSAVGEPREVRTSKKLPSFGKKKESDLAPIVVAPEPAPPPAQGVAEKVAAAAKAYEDKVAGLESEKKALETRLEA